MRSEAYSEAPSYTYMPALDGLRAIAILLVILGHYGLDHLVPGAFGVTLFFFISGFLISRQLAYEKAQTARIHFYTFYMRRVARLMPALVVMILISSAFFLAIGGKISFAELSAALLYTANYYDLYAMFDSNIPGVRHPFIPLWSLAVEEHFYILFPAFFALFYTRRSYLKILLGLLAAALLWRLCVWYGCHGYECGLRGNYRLYKATDTRFDSILYGVLLTAIFNRANTPEWLKGKVLWGAGLVLLLCTFLPRDDFFRETYRYSLQGIALLPLVAAILFGSAFGKLRALLSLKPLLLVGRWSYSLYLYHWVGLMAGEGLVHLHYTTAVLPVAIPVMIVLALGSYYLVEQPTIAWRKRYGSHAK